MLLTPINTKRSHFSQVEKGFAATCTSLLSAATPPAAPEKQSLTLVQFVDPDPALYRHKINIIIPQRIVFLLLGLANAGYHAYPFSQQGLIVFLPAGRNVNQDRVTVLCLG